MYRKSSLSLFLFALVGFVSSESSEGQIFRRTPAPQGYYGQQQFAAPSYYGPQVAPSCTCQSNQPAAPIQAYQPAPRSVSYMTVYDPRTNRTYLQPIAVQPSGVSNWNNQVDIARQPTRIQPITSTEPTNSPATMVGPTVVTPVTSLPSLEGPIVVATQAVDSSLSGNGQTDPVGTQTALPVSNEATSNESPVGQKIEIESPSVAPTPAPAKGPTEKKVFSILDQPAG